MVMKKWICKRCGYTHYGDEAPERCPKCEAPKSDFYCEMKTHWSTWCIVLIIVVIIVTFCFAFCS